MSIKDRLRQLEDKVDRIERAVVRDDVRVGHITIPGNIYVTDYEKIRATLQTPDPEIIGNVMRWNNDNWLESSFVPPEYQRNSRQHLHDCKVYINFDDVPITDALARMRTDDQPIWVMVRDYVDIKENLEQLVAVGCFDKSKTSYKTLDHNNLVGGYRYCRLANIDDLKKAGMR